MTFSNLREFLRHLDKTGDLAHITEPVSRDLEITEITDRVMKGPAAKNKALLFENVTGSRLPVLINQFGTDRRMCMALGTEFFNVDRKKRQQKRNRHDGGE